MKVLMISMFSREEVPYIKFYIDEMKKEKIDYDILFWNREYTAPITKTENEINFSLECKMGGQKYKKIFKMAKYANTIRKYAKGNQYTHVIVLTTVPGIFLFDILLKKYSKKYIYDIRDYTNESNNLYYAIEKKLIFNSAFTSISSKGFEQFLPDYPYVVTHNISNESNVTNDTDDLKNKEKIVIGFVGNVRYPMENKELIKKMSVNSKFRMEYWGKSTVDFDEFMKSKKYSDVQFHGKFVNEEKTSIYKEIDMINAIYGSSGLEVTTAIPNRFYDSIIFKKPIITSKNTYLGTLVEKYDIGLAVDIFNEDIETSITNYIAKFDRTNFIQNCNTALENITEEQKYFSESIRKFLNDKV